jgi:hypothetical protein
MFVFYILCVATLVIIRNVAVEWLTLFLRISEVPGSNLDPETGYPDLRFSWFSSVPPGECRHITLKQTTAASFRILSNLSIVYYS